MKAWKDLEQTVSIYYTGPSDNPNTHWYLDHGVKIEKFPDGSFDINNVMTNGDRYERVTDEQYQVFEEKGWLPGCYNVCAETYQKRLTKVESLIQYAKEETLDDVMARKALLAKKVKRYEELFAKSLYLHD